MDRVDDASCSAVCTSLAVSQGTQTASFSAASHVAYNYSRQQSPKVAADAARAIQRDIQAPSSEFRVDIALDSTGSDIALDSPGSELDSTGSGFRVVIGCPSTG